MKTHADVFVGLLRFAIHRAHCCPRTAWGVSRISGGLCGALCVRALWSRQMVSGFGFPAVDAIVPAAVMRADARAPAVLAVAPLAVMRVDAALAPQQSLQTLLWRLC